MAATSLHRYHQTPLKTLNRGNYFLRNSISVKRKSAVELLQETKSLYVKSETVLDTKQDLKAAAVQPQICTKYVPLPKSPRLSTAVQRRRSQNSSTSDQLQTKLRRLLNGDSKENLLDDTEVEASPRSYRRSVSQPHSTSTANCPVHHKSLPDLASSLSSSGSSQPHSCGYALSAGSNGPELRSRCSSSKEAMSISVAHDGSHRSQASTLSVFGNNCIDSPSFLIKTRHSQADSNNGAEERTVEESRLRPILRSKSDVGQDKLSALSQIAVTPEELETFFQHLGLGVEEYNRVTHVGSDSSSAVFFSDTGSVDSMTLCLAGGSGNTVQELPSIVERNARIIKWLCNCRKALLQDKPRPMPHSVS